MMDEDVTEPQPGTVDLSLRGWRTLDQPLDPRARVVRLEHNALIELPRTIGTLTMMTHLDVSHNALAALPVEIGTCLRLRVLNVACNALTRLPDELGACLFLEALRAEQNRLTTLPDSIGALKALKVLTLQHNKLTTLPYSIGGIETLEELDCSDNDSLSTVPRNLRTDSELAQYCLGMHFQTTTHALNIKAEHAELQVALMRREEANLRLRDAIEVVKEDKEAILRSLVPGSSLSDSLKSAACTFM